MVILSIASVQAAQQPAKLIILCSGGLRSTVQAIASNYQKQTGIYLDIKEAPSMGNTPQSIPQRLARHEPADVLVLVADALDSLQVKRLVVNSSRQDIADSYIAMAIKEGEISPSIGTVDELRETLLKAKSIAYSDSASGRYLSEQLFKKLGIDKQLKDKAHMIPATPVGKIAAEGKAEIGFQQYSELLPIKGIHIVGLIPKQTQKITRYVD